MFRTVDEIMNTEIVFATLVKRDHKFGNNEFVLGKISAFQELLCDGVSRERDLGTYPIVKCDEGYLLRTRCTPDEYVDFTRLVKNHYPDLCVFNY